MAQPMSEMQLRTLEMKIAECAHNMNRLYCEQLGDFTHKSWEHCPQDLKASVIEGVKQIMVNPELSPEDSHSLWMQRKLDEGWRFNPHKSVQHKTHPCMVEYEKLPLMHRMKDVIFGAVVRSQLENAGVLKG